MNTKRFTATLSLALALGLFESAAISLAETFVTTTVKATTYSGVVSEIDPSTSTMILKSEAAPAPVTCNLTKETASVDAQGNVVSYETIRNSPVTVEYMREGDRTVVTRVVTTRPAAVTRKVETTMHTLTP